MLRYTVACVLVGLLMVSSASAATMTWDAGGGAADTNWSTGSNWTGAPDNTTPSSGDDAALGGSTARTVTIATGDQPVANVNVTGTAAWTINGANTLNVSGAFNYGSSGASTMSAILGGAGSLSVTGGTLTLSGANTYGGGTFLSAGTLNIRNNTALGSGTFTITGGTFGATGMVVSNAVSLGGNVTFGSTSNLGPLAMTGNWTLSGATRTLTTATGAELQLLGAIGENAAGLGLTKAGSGTVTLYGGSNTFTGAFNISAGTARLMNASALSGLKTQVNGGGTVELAVGNMTMALGTGAGQIDLSASGSTGAGFAALRTNRDVNFNNDASQVAWASGQFLPGGAALILGSTSSDARTRLVNAINLNGAARTVTVNQNLYVANDYAEISGNITGAGSEGLTKNGTGTLVLSGTNSYSGVTTISAGALRVGGTLANSNVLLAGGVLELTADLTADLGVGAAAVGKIDLSGTTSSGGFAAYGGARSVTLNSGSTLVWGSTAGFLGAGKSLLFGDAATADAAITLTNNIDLNGAARTIAVTDNIMNQSDKAVLSGTISGAAGSLVFNSTGGTLVLTGSNSYGAGTTLTAGYLRVGNNSALGGGTLTLNGGILTTDGQTARSLANTLTINANSTLGDNTRASENGAVTFIGAVTALAASRTLTVWNDTTIQGNIGETAVSTLTKDGGGALTLSGNNSFSGGVTVSGGVLRIGHNGAIGGGTLTVAPGAGKVAVVTAAGSTARSISNAINFNNTVYLGDETGGTANNGALTFSGTQTAFTADRTWTIFNTTTLTSNLPAAAFGLIVRGTGTLVLEGSANALTGGTALSIQEGTVKLDSLGKFSSATGGIAVFNPGLLVLDNDATNVTHRLAGKAVTLSGGELRLLGNSGGASLETIGALTLSPGADKVTVTPNALQAATFTAADLTGRTTSNGKGYTIFYQGAGLGGSSGAGVANIKSATAPTLFGNGSGSGTQTKVLVAAVGSDLNTGPAKGFVTYDATNGVTLLSSFTTSLDNLGVNNVRLTSAAAPTGASDAGTLTLGAGAGIATVGPQTVAARFGIFVESGADVTIAANSLVLGQNFSTLGAGLYEGILYTVGDLTVNAQLSVSAAADRHVVKSGSGTLTLGQAAAYGGSLYLNEGTVKLAGGFNTLPGGQTVVMNGGTLDLAGNTQRVDLQSSVTYGSGGGIVTSTGPGAATLVNNSASSRTLPIALQGNMNLSKQNSGTLTLRGGNSTMTGEVNVLGGTLELVDGARFSAASAFNVNLATLRLNNQGEFGLADRLNTAATVTLRGGTIRYAARYDQVANGNYTMGPVVLARGANILEIQPPAEASNYGIQPSSLTIPALTRTDPAATVQYSAYSNVAGSYYTTFPDPQQVGTGNNNVRLYYTAAPALDDGIIGGWAVVADYGNTYYDFASYDVARGVTSLDGQVFRPGQLRGAVAADNVRATGSLASLTADTSVNSFAWNASGTFTADLGGYRLNIESGGLIRGDNAAGTGTLSNGSLTAGGSTPNSNLYVYTSNFNSNANTLNVNVPIVNNPGGAVGLVKFGGGTLVLGAANTFTGPVTLNQGVLTLGPAASLASTSVQVVSGTMNMGNNDQLPSAANLTVNSGTFALTTFNQTLAGLTLDFFGGTAVPTVSSTTGTLTVTGDVRVSNYNYAGSALVSGLLALGNSAAHAFTVDGPGDLVALNVTASISGGGSGFQIVKEGSGRMNLAPALAAGGNTFTGDIVINGGSLWGAILSGTTTASPFGNAGNDVFLNNDGALGFSGGGASPYGNHKFTLDAITFSGGNRMVTNTGTNGYQATVTSLARAAGSRGSLLLQGNYTSTNSNDHFAGNPSWYILDWKSPNPDPNDAGGLLPAYFAMAGYTVDNKVATFTRADTSTGRILNATGAKTSFAAATLTTHWVDLAAGESMSASKDIWALKTAYDVVVASGSPVLGLLNGGLIVNYDNTVAPAIRFGPSGSPAEAVIFVAATRTANLPGTMITTAGLTKFGDGTLVLSADNSATLSGDIWINNGVLRMAGSKALGLDSQANAVVIQQGATLDLAGSYTLSNLFKGKGQITTGANVFTLGASGRIAPGLSIGALTIEDLDFRGTYDWEFNENGNDLIETQTLVFGAATATLNVLWTGAGDAPTGTWTLMTYTGSDPTNATWTVNAPAGLTGLVTVDGTNNRVLLTLTETSVPEPATLALLTLGGLGAFGQLARRRRRSGLASR
ncbi:MAG: hypothetical protein BIFFINMI_00893 [Phycisphaerae bacterium]|nr:hypothetical protein [Phycisphaerae bacterium]